MRSRPPRRLRFTGPEIAETRGMPMGKLGRPGRKPAERYERARPAELIHIDVNELGRVVRRGHRMLGRRSAEGYHRRRYEPGWEFVHIAIDDCTRPAYVEVLSDEKAATAVGFLRRAIAFYLHLAGGRTHDGGVG